LWFEFYTSKSKHAGRSRSHSSSETARPPPRRSNTDHGRGQRHHRHHDDQTSSRSRSAATTSVTASTATTASAKRHHRARSATTHMYYTASSDATAVPIPVRSQTMPITTVPGGQKIMLPLGEPGQSYLIIPTRGNQIDVVASPSPDTKNHHYTTGASSPIKKSLPLFKRLLSSFTNSQDRSLSPSSSRTGSSRSRSQEGVRSWTLVDTFDPNSSGSTLVEDSERKSKSSRSSGSKAYVESGGKEKRSREGRSQRERSGSR